MVWEGRWSGKRLVVISEVLNRLQSRCSGIDCSLDYLLLVGKILSDVKEMWFILNCFSFLLWYMGFRLYSEPGDGKTQGVIRMELTTSLIKFFHRCLGRKAYWWSQTKTCVGHYSEPFLYCFESDIWAGSCLDWGGCGGKWLVVLLNTYSSFSVKLCMSASFLWFSKSLGKILFGIGVLLRAEIIAYRTLLRLIMYWRNRLLSLSGVDSTPGVIRKEWPINPSTFTHRSLGRKAYWWAQSLFCVLFLFEPFCFFVVSVWEGVVWIWLLYLMNGAVEKSAKWYGNKNWRKKIKWNCYVIKDFLKERQSKKIDSRRWCGFVANDTQVRMLGVLIEEENATDQGMVSCRKAWCISRVSTIIFKEGHGQDYE